MYIIYVSELFDPGNGAQVQNSAQFLSATLMEFNYYPIIPAG